MLNSAVKGIVLSLAVTFAAQAQEIFKLNSFGGGFNVMLGYQSYDPSGYFGSDLGMGDKLPRTTFSGTTSKLRTETNATFKKPSSGVLNLGFQGLGVFNSFIVGGELNFNVGTPSVGNHTESTYDSNGVLQPSADKKFETNSRMAGVDVLVNLGFVALRKRGLIVYPLIGLGYGASGILLSSEASNRLYPDITFPVTDSDPNLQNIFIWTRTPVYDFGIGAQYMLGASTEDRAKGFSLGLRMGYKLQQASNNILVNEKKVADGLEDEDKNKVPKVDLSGFYIKLLIGFGKIGE
jgi:hypothetical protein